MAQHDSSDKAAHIAMGMVIGAAAGVIIGLLTAPRSGAETRGRIHGRALYARDVAQEKIDAGRNIMADKLHQTAEKSKKAADTMADATKGAVDKAANRSKQIADKA